jgi:uncharacterized membrane protein
MHKIGSDELAAPRLLLIEFATMDGHASVTLSCPSCAARMPETAAFCPGCGAAMKAPARASERVGLFGENVAGALAYITFIPAIVFLALDPYRKSQFVRFHSAQCLLLWITALLIVIVLKLAGLVLFAIPVAGPLFGVLIYILSGLAVFMIWLVLFVKALQGESFMLPVLGSLADRYADTP